MRLAREAPTIGRVESVQLLRDRVGDRGLERVLRAGDFVHLQGDVAETVSLVLSGQLLANAYPDSGWRAEPIGVIGPGMILGDDALVPGCAERRATVRCLTDTSLVVVYRRDLQEVMTRSAAVQDLVLGLLAERMRALEAEMLAGATASVELRIARWLSHLHATFAPCGRPDQRININQEDLAMLAGTRRPTVNRIVKSFEGEGLVRLGRGWISVCDPEALLRWLVDAAAQE